MRAGPAVAPELLAAARRAARAFGRPAPPEGDDRLDRWPPGGAAYGDVPDDPYGGRLDPLASVDVVLQVSADLHRFCALGAADTDRMGAALARCWSRLGIGPGDRVAVYDFATCPLAAFASIGFLPHLRWGAADVVGVTVACNDGLPEFAPRAVELLRLFRPNVLFLGADVVRPFMAALHHGDEAPGGDTTVVVAADEEPLGAERLRAVARSVSLPVTQVLRVDGALFFAAPCLERVDVFHPDPADYVVEILDAKSLTPTRAGLLTVTNRGVHAAPIVRHVTDVEVAFVTSDCGCAGNAPSVLVGRAADGADG